MHKRTLLTVVILVLTLEAFWFISKASEAQEVEILLMPQHCLDNLRQTERITTGKEGFERWKTEAWDRFLVMLDSGWDPQRAIDRLISATEGRLKRVERYTKEDAIEYLVNCMNRYHNVPAQSGSAETGICAKERAEVERTNQAAIKAEKRFEHINEVLGAIGAWENAKAVLEECIREGGSLK